MEKKQYICPKCGSREYEHDEIHTTGGKLAKMFDVQNKKFIAVSCARCGYTDLYKGKTSTGMNILDFLTS